MTQKVAANRTHDSIKNTARDPWDVGLRVFTFILKNSLTMSMSKILQRVGGAYRDKMRWEKNHGDIGYLLHLYQRSTFALFFLWILTAISRHFIGNP